MAPKKEPKKKKNEVIPDKISADHFQQLLKDGKIQSTKRGIKQSSLQFEGDPTDITDISPIKETKYNILPSVRLVDNGHYSSELLAKMREVKTIFIPGEVFSSKNSRQIFYRFTAFSDCCGAESTGKGVDRICLKCKKHCKPKQIPFIDKSKAAKEYDNEMLPTYSDRRDQFIEMIKGKSAPLYIGLFFSRKTRREFDYNNISQAVMDIMKTAGWIPEDCMNVTIPVYLGYIVNSNNPGVVITVLHADMYHEAMVESLQNG